MVVGGILEALLENCLGEICSLGNLFSEVLLKNLLGKPSRQSISAELSLQIVADSQNNILGVFLRNESWKILLVSSLGDLSWEILFGSSLGKLSRQFFLP